jgi:hypothetical protein
VVVVLKPPSGYAPGGVTYKPPPKPKKKPLVDPWQVAAGLAPAESGAYNTPAWQPPDMTPGSPGIQGPPGSITLPGYEPNWADLIAGDPDVISGLADIDLYQTQLGTAKSGAIRRALIDAGIVPAGNFPDVDEATRAAAAANPFSSRAEIQRARERGSADLGANLADRGLYSQGAGALRAGEGRLQEGQERGLSQLSSKLLDLIAGAESDYSGKLFGLGRERAGLRQAAAARLQSDPRFTPRPGGTAKLDPGTGLYRTDDGRWYDANGNPVNAPDRVQAAPPSAPPAYQLPPPIYSIGPPPTPTQGGGGNLSYKPM